MKEREKQDITAITNDQLGPVNGGFKKPYYKGLYRTVEHGYKIRGVFPEPGDIFNAFAFTPLADVKAVVLRQNPYHNYGQAHGLYFSVKPNMDIPPSLVSICQELHDDLGCYIPNNGYLKKWADQGVILLDTVLTVRAHRINSRRDIGWEKFTDAAISILSQQDRPMVSILWGRPAQVRRAMLNNPGHLILETPHPSPLSTSRGSLNSRSLSKTSAFLTERDLTPVDWQIENVQNRYRDR